LNVWNQTPRFSNLVKGWWGSYSEAENNMIALKEKIEKSEM